MNRERNHSAVATTSRLWSESQIKTSGQGERLQDRRAQGEVTGHRVEESRHAALDALPKRHREPEKDQRREEVCRDDLLREREDGVHEKQPETGETIADRVRIVR